MQIAKLPVGEYQVTTTSSGFAAASTQFSHRLNQSQTIKVFLGGPLPEIEPNTTHIVSSLSAGVPSSEDNPPITNKIVASVIAEEKQLNDETEVQRYLNEQSQAKHRVISIISLANNKSIFVFKTESSSATYIALLVPKPIDQADLTNRLAQYTSSQLLGIHRLTANSYVLVLIGGAN
jgi:hypothetical protein